MKLFLILSPFLLCGAAIRKAIDAAERRRHGRRVRSTRRGEHLRFRYRWNHAVDGNRTKRGGPKTVAINIDPDSSKYVRIANSYIDSWDYAIYPKTSLASEKLRATEHLIVPDCILRSASNGDLKTSRSRTPRCCAGKIVCSRGRGIAAPRAGTVANISLSNIVATGGIIASSITGVPGFLVHSVSLSDMNFGMKGACHRVLIFSNARLWAYALYARMSRVSARKPAAVHSPLSGSTTSRAR
jgi:hypothetical protein